MMAIIIITYEYKWFKMFLCLKLYFSSPFSPTDPFHDVNFLLSHSSCFFLHYWISRSSPWTPCKFVWGSLSSFILCTWPYLFNRLYLSNLTPNSQYLFVISRASRRSPKKMHFRRHKFRFKIFVKFACVSSVQRRKK